MVGSNFLVHIGEGNSFGMDSQLPCVALVSFSNGFDAPPMVAYNGCLYGNGHSPDQICAYNPGGTFGCMTRFYCPWGKRDIEHFHLLKLETQFHLLEQSRSS